jgi:regulator of cell morphogenesis and NO signaling
VRAGRGSQEPIHDGLTVNEAIRRFPTTVAVFNEFAIDACCGGAAPLTEAAARHSIDTAMLLEILEDAARGDG